MSVIRNKYHSYCNRGGKELQAGEGFLIPRNRGFEISCSTQCLMTNLRMPNACVIEVRVKTPQVTSLTAQEPYWQKAENILMRKIKELFFDYKHKINTSNIFRGNGISEEGEVYCYVKTSLHVKNKHKNYIVINA